VTGVLLVTGGSRGIGAAVARQAAARGWDVCLTYLSDAAAAEAVVADVRAAGRAARAVRADLREEEDIMAAFDAAAALGRLTAFVANAGVVAPQATVAELTAERVRDLVAVNVTGTILCCREAVRRLGRGGSIVLVSSAASRLGSPFEYVDYAASKAAVDTLGLGLAKEVAKDGIRVNVVRPGLTDTEIHERNGQPGRVARIAAGIPLGRAATADEVAQAILWLACDEAAYCTGSVVDVAGGR
jgi:NAD(P)-dependent dehydrogenase (short-subunit alcohol dehydrogenase family)